MKKLSFLSVGVYFYVLVFNHHAVWDIGGSTGIAKIFAFLGIVLGVDFFYYWFHRKSHEVNILWAGHSVHHQSEEYNLSVALRQMGWDSQNSRGAGDIEETADKDFNRRRR